MCVGDLVLKYFKIISAVILAAVGAVIAFGFGVFVVISVIKALICA